MSLTAMGGGSREWSIMNKANRDMMKAWKKSGEKRMNKGKRTVGIPMQEVPVEYIRVQYVE